MTLNDNLWKELQGGYRMDYDASVPLRQLEQTTDKKYMDELWIELHHQGDVGLASYLSLPQLVRKPILTIDKVFEVGVGSQQKNNFLVTDRWK